MIGAGSDFHHLSLAGRLIFRDISGDRTGSDRVRTRKIQLSRTAATWEVAVLRADYDLIGTGGNSGSGINAGSATRFNYFGSSFLKDIEIALANAVVARVLRAELDIELDR